MSDTNTPEPRMAHIVWNEARNEGVIFMDLPPEGVAEMAENGWPLTPADDAHQASTGTSRRRGLGSSLAEAFYEAYEDDDERPIQTLPASVFEDGKR